MCQKLNNKLCSDPGSNRGAVEPSVGSLTRYPQSYEVIKKIPQKNPYILWAKICHVLPMGLLIGGGRKELDF
jgi:hypothetical protein